MSTQDFIARKRIDVPRHDQNMPEGIKTAAPKGWIAHRPGDFKQIKRDSDDMLLGNPGPNVGYALRLVHRKMSDLILFGNENLHDVGILLAEIAMRKASVFGRAPIGADVDFAAHLLSYDIQPTQGEEKWRPTLVRNCGHDEHRRRVIVNSIPQQIIEREDELHDGAISGWWEKLEQLF